MAQERIYWVDNLKGFLLILVVIQHVLPNVGPNLPHPFAQWYCAFHMPAFFFLSGLLFYPKKYVGIKEYARNKWHSLLKPYFFVTCFFSLLDPKLWLEVYPHPSAGILNKFVFSWLDCSPFWHGFITHLYTDFLDIVSGISVFVVGPMWFLWALFGCSMLFYVFHRIVHNYRCFVLFLTLFTLFCGIIGWLLFRNDVGLPLNLHVIVTSLFYYGMGYLMKQLICNFNKNQIIWILAAFSIYLFGYSQNGVVALIANLWGTGNLFESVCASLGGSLFIVFLFCAYITKRIRVLSFIAQNAIVILAVHMWTIYSCNYFYPDSNLIIRFLIVVVVTLCAIPIFNRYLYFLIGKKKQSFAETFNI